MWGRGACSSKYRCLLYIYCYPEIDKERRLSISTAKVQLNALLHHAFTLSNKQGAILRIGNNRGTKEKMKSASQQTKQAGTFSAEAQLEVVVLQAAAVDT